MEMIKIKSLFKTFLDFDSDSNHDSKIMLKKSEM